MNLPRPQASRLVRAVFQVAQLTARRMAKGWRPAIGRARRAPSRRLRRPGPRNGASQDEPGRFSSTRCSGGWHFGIAVPVVALLFASRFPWPESDEGTLRTGFTSPIRRWNVCSDASAASLLVGSSCSASASRPSRCRSLTTDEAGVGAGAEDRARLHRGAAVSRRPADVPARRHRSPPRPGFGGRLRLRRELLASLPGTIAKLTMLFYVALAALAGRAGEPAVDVPPREPASNLAPSRRSSA